MTFAHEPWFVCGRELSASEERMKVTGHMSSPCVDCGADTTPESGPWEWYMVHDAVWEAAGMPSVPQQAFLCVGCLEKRLGRQLDGRDFTSAWVNDPVHLHTPRLLSRMSAPRRLERERNQWLVCNPARDPGRSAQ